MANDIVINGTTYPGVTGIALLDSEGNTVIFGSVRTVNGMLPDANGNVTINEFDKNALSLGIASDGLMYVFVNGEPVGNGVERGQNGDVFGFVDENNTIVLTGNLADGTYTVKYEMDNGDVVSVGNMVLDSNVYYSVTSTLTKCSISNSTKTVVAGSSYTANITANSGYGISSVKVTMGGTDITSSAYSNGKITIASVTGNIVITATAAANTYTVTKNLTNCSISNTASSVTHGASYSATVTANSGCTLKSVTVTMGGSAVSVTNGVINIASVTGNIVITAVAEEVVAPEPTYTNLAKNFTVGRFKSDGTIDAETTAATACTDYIGPLVANDVVRIKGFGAMSDYNSVWYNASKGAYDAGKPNAYSGSAATYAYDSATGVVTIKKVTTNQGYSYFRAGGKLTGTTADVVITLNEPIV